jgi:hypothetical protein
MNPQNVLKGRVLEGLVTTLFKRAKYKVVPLGVENQFPDIDALTVAEYKDQLPEALRLLPDLMIYRWDDGAPKVSFIEVKYRTSLPDVGAASLRSSLLKQKKHWPETKCVLALANPTSTSGKEYHQYHFRVFDFANLEESPADASGFWGSGETIRKAFPEFESFLNGNPLTDVFGADYAASLEPLLDDSVKIVKALGEIEPRK